MNQINHKNNTCPAPGVSSDNFAIVGGGGFSYSGSFLGLGNYICGNASFIGGGQLNCIKANCASILGGCGNTVCDNWGVILGGCGNCVCSGHDYAAVFGCNVCTVTGCAFHANNFVAQNMFLWGSGPLPATGTLYYCNCGFGNCPVFIV